ncbi:hypothetical protein NLJ89_g7059 [Agrocybe chaxingu]|uniref:Uncharacterized protein n=1 Tax=Agrocybe chaxingu TaxID=84603 RepID=A0A9W8MVU0_9AGAR|nr:hypothetical protein NLJ89_g7059 [Agrocybe chaxingu]
MTAFPPNRPPPDARPSERPHNAEIPDESLRTTQTTGPQPGQEQMPLARGNATLSSPALSYRSRTLSSSSSSTISSSRSTSDLHSAIDSQVEGPPPYTDTFVAEPIDSTSEAPQAPNDASLCLGYVEEAIATGDGSIERVALPCDHDNPRCEALRNDLAARAFEDQAGPIPVYDVPFNDAGPRILNRANTRDTGPPAGSWTIIDDPTNMAYFWNSRTGNLLSASLSGIRDFNVLYTAENPFVDRQTSTEGVTTTPMTQDEAQAFRESMQRTTEQIQRDVERAQREAERARRNAERQQRHAFEQAQREMEQGLRQAEQQMREAQRRTEHELRRAMGEMNRGMGEMNRGMQDHAAQMRHTFSQTQWPRWNGWGRHY